MRRRLPVLLLTAVALAYGGSLFYAARTYPSGYDLRHTVVSNLANPNDNPRPWRVAADGIAITGILIALLGLEVRRALRPLAPKWTAWVCAFFVLGGMLLTVSALVQPGHYALLSLPKAHAKIAQAASFVLGLGMICTLPALLRLPPRLALLRAVVVLVAVGPVILYLLCRIIFPLAEAYASPDQRAAIHDSLFISLAFWEWIGAASTYIFITLVTLVLPEEEITNRGGPSRKPQ